MLEISECSYKITEDDYMNVIRSENENEVA